MRVFTGWIINNHEPDQILVRLYTESGEEHDYWLPGSLFEGAGFCEENRPFELTKSDEKTYTLKPIGSDKPERVRVIPKARVDEVIRLLREAEAA